MDMKIKCEFYEIFWDTDGEDVELPEKIVMMIDSNADIENDGADILANKYDWCVNSFKYRII